MQPSSTLEELKKCNEGIDIIKKVINFACSRDKLLDDEDLKRWQPVLAHIIEIFIRGADVERERMLLASHAFFALLSKRSTSATLKHYFMIFMNSNSELYYLDKKYNIADSELFKLNCVYGYLQVNHTEIYSNDVRVIMFNLIENNCIRYTRHSYFAFKILYMWLRRTMNTNFWDTCDLDLEQRLEAIIFSNWCNAIKEISKQNSTSIFNLYLRIMSTKYDGFIEYMFKHYVENISWQNEIKYIALAEICEAWDNVQAMTSYDFLLSLSTSLTKHYLRTAGTKVYITIAKKLNESEWINTFGNLMKFLFHQWETEENANQYALQSLCKYWFEPVVKKHKGVIPYLWKLTEDLNGYFLRSYIQRMASEMHIHLPQQIDIERYVYHKEEIVRLNGFAISCYQINSSCYRENQDRFVIIRNVLWQNANSTSVYMRDGIVKYFKIFYAYALKLCETDPDCVEDVCYITHWLHEFLLDCFEIGSCYQRKIFGLNLYRAMFSFINGNAFDKRNKLDNTSFLFNKHILMTGNWKYTDKKSLFSLLTLVLDSANDVRQFATSIILEYFDKNVLSDSEKQVIYNVALENCNSSKFYKIESGASLITILANWLPLKDLRNIVATDKCENNFDGCTTYSDFLLNEAASQLSEMRKDILKSIVQNKPFYGVLTALLNVIFQNGPESSILTLEYIKKVLNLLKEAVEFFLSVLSSKSANTEYSSSFAEMGLAIENAIKTSEVDDSAYDELNLTPAHQLIISCIWMTLKVSCEIACQIGALMYSEETVKQSADIIVTILFRCRHKGAVESAGVAIGDLTRSLCKEGKYCELPKMYILNILKNDTMHSLNITRRSAGLSIMFHKIVVSDNRRDRPLLHFAIQMLLNLLVDYSELSSTDRESQHDLPCARRLHFLCTLVADKEINAQLIPYMEIICLISFHYLESEVWTIRNASLQLFGAIVPRLAGQSYGDASLDFGTGYTISHFVTHFPTLADHVMGELEKFSSTFVNFSTALYLHSNIVHVLILLSKFSTSGCDSIDYLAREFILKAKHLLRSLFNDPVLYVRLLAAKAYTALTAFSSINEEIGELKRDVFSSRNANLIHGHLLAVKYLKQKLSLEMEDKTSCSETIRCKNNQSEQSAELMRLRQVINLWGGKSEGQFSLCYVIEALFLQLSESISDQISVTDIFAFHQNVFTLSREKVQPGFYQFVDLSIKLYTDYVKRTNNVSTDVVHRILNSHCVDQSISLLNNLPQYHPIFKIVLERLLLSDSVFNDLLLNAMINFVLRTLKHSLLSFIDDLHVRKLIENISVKVEENMVHSNLWRLKSILITLFSKNETLVNEILSYIRTVTMHDEEHMRQMAVEFMEFSVRRFEILSDANKLNVLHSCLILLKDEISEIRELIAECLRVYLLPQINIRHGILQHDEAIYQKLLSLVMFDESQVFILNRDMNLNFIKLFTQNTKNLATNAIIENPFYHDDNPFYREESKFLNICFNYSQHSSKRRYNKCNLNNSTVEYNNEDVDILHELQAKYHLQEKIGFDNTNLDIILHTKYMDYLLRKRGFVIQEYN